MAGPVKRAAVGLGGRLALLAVSLVVAACGVEGAASTFAPGGAPLGTSPAGPLAGATSPAAAAMPAEPPAEAAQRPRAPQGVRWDLPPLAPPADPARGLEPYVVPLAAWMAPMPVPADNPLTHAGVDLGRRLFYDPLLSGNGTQSCSSCHIQSLAFTDGRPRSVGSEGAPVRRNSMSLVNLAWSPPYFWDGRAPTLEALVPMPLADPTEMNQPLPQLLDELRAHPDYPSRFAAAFPDEGITERAVARAIAQFLRTLVSFGSRADQLDAGITMTPLEQQGMQLLSSALPKGSPHAVKDICNACHDHAAGTKYANRGMGAFTRGDLKVNGLPPGEDLGVADLSGRPEDRMRFKVPTIRNVAVTGPYMHDGRLATLQDVARHYDGAIVDLPGLEAPLRLGGAPARLALDEGEVEALAAALGLFTDPAFLSNPAYADPGGR